LKKREGDAIIMGGRGRNSNRFYLHWGKQGKHIPGHNNYDPKRSPVISSKERLQELFEKYRGTGERVGNKEVVDFEEVIGQVKNPATGEIENTTWGKIHYDEDGGYHIVPYYSGN
jgi:hypothetical protein